MEVVQDLAPTLSQARYPLAPAAENINAGGSLWPL